MEREESLRGKADKVKVKYIFSFLSGLPEMVGETRDWPFTKRENRSRRKSEGATFPTARKLSGPFIRVGPIHWGIQSWVGGGGDPRPSADAKRMKVWGG